MLLLLYSGQSAVISGAAGIATGQSFAAAQSAKVLVPLGLLLLFEDNPSFGISTASVGNATGLSSVNATGAYGPFTFAAVGNAIGLSSVNATGAYGPFTFPAKGTASGLSSVNAISSIAAFIFPAVGNSFGLSSVNATGAYGPFTFSSKGTSAGLSSVNATGAYGPFTFLAKGIAAGLSSVNAVTPSVINFSSGQGIANGTSTVNAFTGSTRPADGLAFGSVTAFGVSPFVFGSIGLATGVSFVGSRSAPLSVAVGPHFLPFLLKSEFSKAAFTLFTAIRIQYKFYTSHVLDSSGIVVINGETYTGRDPSHGTLVSLDTISDGTGDDAPAIRVVMLPPDSLSSWFMLDQNVQGALVKVFIGAIEPTTGILLGYQQVFLGEVDVSTLEVDNQFRQVTLDCVSVFERFFDDEEGTRLTDSWHESVWPGEQGLIYVTDIERQIPWGVDAPLTPPVHTSPTTSTNYDINRPGFFF